MEGDQSWAQLSQTLSKPPGSRVKLQRDFLQLHITIPARGSGCTSLASIGLLILLAVAFAHACILGLDIMNGVAVVVLGILCLGSLGWALRDACMHETLDLGPEVFSFQRLLFKGIRQLRVSGHPREVLGFRLWKEWSKVESDDGFGASSMKKLSQIELVHGDHTYCFGSWLTQQEQQWLIHELNDQLESIRRAAVSEGKALSRTAARSTRMKDLIPAGAGSADMPSTRPLLQFDIEQPD